ncbi:hypothetical protein ACPOL_4831 [Acidisarcina polymorpha]|uniref:DUF308 domain-containing protein n=1 Tax=Acidisarcina polymorpha TaxID=2211140 RepID=A0A2Z5G4G5_9BACT|nr:hypothetical protein [Acidisarcina polymorpha]AXC14093.1 hypothetical protein ACPOL_4831 [Acidisarcina polymorpha]
MEAILPDSARSLRNLYFVRTVFQAVWAASVFTTAIKQPKVAAILFFLYPLWDVACTVYDLNTSSRSGSARSSQIINALLGVGAAIGIGLTVFHQPVYSVAVFGVWAFGAGLLQHILGLIRRRLLRGGQWAMILSGAQSMIAGVAYFLGGLFDKLHIKDVGGYAMFGAIYFLIGGILLTRKLSKPSTIDAN